MAARRSVIAQSRAMMLTPVDALAAVQEMNIDAEQVLPKDKKALFFHAFFVIIKKVHILFGCVQQALPDAKYICARKKARCFDKLLMAL